MSPSLIAAIILAYLAIIFLISLLTTGKNASGNDFYTGGRKSPWWVVAISMVGTSISGVTFISVPGMVKASLFSYMQMAIGFFFGYVFIAYILLPVYYNRKLFSIYGYLEERFGKASYKTGAVFFLLSKYLGCGVRMYLTAIVLQLLLFDKIGVSFSVNVAVTMLVVWAYTFRGGVKTLVWTDMVQTIAMLSAVVLCIVFIGKELGLDLGAMTAAIKDSEMSRTWFFDDPMDRRWFFKQFLAGAFTTIAMTGLDQDMMQKNLSCPSLRDARKDMLSYGFSFIPVNFLFLCLGVLLYIYAGSVGFVPAKPDDLFPTLAVNYLPGAVGIIFMLGLVSASFSSAGSALTSLTTTITLDIFGVGKEEAASGRNVRLRRLVHAANAVLMALVIIMFQVIGSGSVIDAVYTVASYTYGPLLGLFLFGIATKRKAADGLVPFICILSPIICLVLATHSREWFGGYEMGFEVLLYNAAITFAALLLTSKKNP